MTHRRTQRSRIRRPRRTTNWHGSVISTGFSDVAAGVNTDVVLYIPPAEQDMTVLRIVGAIAVTPQAAAKAVAHWCIYRAKVVAGSVISIEPATLAGVDDEDIMHWRPVHWTNVSSANFDTPTMVDIKVKRTLKDGDSQLMLAIDSLVAYSWAASLRFLLAPAAGS